MIESLDSPPRFEVKRLDVRVASADPASPHGEHLARLVLRLFTGDLFEGGREEDEWMFAANRLEPDLTLIVNISFGYAEIEAEASSWQAVLTAAAGRALALWDAHPQLVETGHVATAPQAAPLPEPLEVGELTFEAGGWSNPNLGLVVDLAEFDTGDRAWREIVSTPEVPDEPVEGCPGCEGEPLLLIETSEGYMESLCRFHQSQQGADQADAAGTGDGWITTGEIMIASIPSPGNPVVTGLAARADQVDLDDVESCRAFLDWVVGVFQDRPDVFGSIVATGYETDPIYQAIHEVRRDDPAVSLEYGTQLADLAGPAERWVLEIGVLESLVDLGRQAEADQQIEAWLEQADTTTILYMVVADQLISWGRHAEAIEPLWKMYGHAVIEGDERNLTYALANLARSFATLDRGSEAAELEERLAQIEARGVAWLRPGRNDPCPCGSGLKSKRCCGRPRSTSHSHANRASNKGEQIHGKDTGSKIAFAWFPAEEWPKAFARWPVLLEENPEDHLEYSHRIESKLKQFRSVDHHVPLAVAPLTVDELIEESGDEAGESSARAHVAARMAQQGRATDWPPGPNEPCWCGSGQTYQRCCGPIPPAEFDPD